MATEGQKRRLAALNTGLRDHVKAWCKEHEVTSNELVAVVAALPMQAMLDCGKTPDEVRAALEMILVAVMNTPDPEADQAIESVNTRAPRAIEGGN